MAIFKISTFRIKTMFNFNCLHHLASISQTLNAFDGVCMVI